MSKIKTICLCLAAALTFSACGAKRAPAPKEETDNKVAAEQSQEEKIPVTDRAELAADREIVGGMLECFKNLDYEGAMEFIRESDRARFDLSNVSQKTLYDCLFVKLGYEIGDSYVQGGKKYVPVSIGAPDMLDVYGELNLRYIDAMMNGEISTEDESRNFNNEALPEIMESADIKTKTTEVNVELQACADGEERVVFTSELMNAMMGDIQTASDQISKALEEGVAEYNSAKESGALD